ncbi:hypothetical protein CERZMDRAFT_102381 [Cercospora zeae-maydis SCOH1-5]|uniref:Uncharacterized protein n=1 Tax=Cercospora zeae-maydis SCOH1-5 TaxID=717836 RepID=A0A6A6F2F2_9PEZI|nr:hypothetical protein CERZMDRAFT_102381 [Cercospora zeae-maydis SCOH1-5]
MFQKAARGTPRADRVARRATFLDQRGRPPYYEDIYGSRDAGEDNEGPAEQCESESDSDGDVRTRSKKARGNAKRYKGREKNGRSTVVGPTSKDAAIYMSSDSGESDGEDKPSSSNAIDSSTQDPSHRHEYRIAPNLNSKHSLPRAEVRRLQVRKCGLFSGAFGSGRDDTAEVVGTTEDNGVVAGDGESEMAGGDGSRRRERRGQVTRRATRMSIKQQLAERVAAKKQAEKAKKLAVRRSKPAASRSSIGSKSSKRAAMVLLDHSGIDFAEYTRYCD